MKKISLAAVLVAATFALSACKKDEPATTPATPETTAAAPAPAAPEAPAAAPPAADPAAAAPVAAGESLGVPECDDFLTKYEACVSNNVPAEARAAFQQSLDATRSGWKQIVASGGKDQLGAACTQMREQSKASMQAYGCTF